MYVKLSCDAGSFFCLLDRSMGIIRHNGNRAASDGFFENANVF